MLKEKFVDYIRFERRFSGHTITAYQHDLQQFADYLAFQYNLQDISLANHSMIRSWLVSLLSDKMTSRSVNRKLSTLKSFYRFCKKQGIISENPMSRIVSLKTSVKLPAFLEKESTEKLVAMVSSSDGFEHLRDAMIVLMFYTTGMRLSELCSLTHQSVDISKQTVRVHGKRNKERIIPLGSPLLNLLEKYLDAKKEYLKSYSIPNKTESLFVTTKGKPVYQRLVYEIVHSNLSGVSTLEKLSPHLLRHTFATQMLNEGADLNAIKEILGHASLAATQVYTHNTIEKLKSIYNQAHPRA